MPKETYFESIYQRRGILYMQEEALIRLSKKQLQEVFGRMIVLRGEYDYASRTFEYVALSEHFDVIPEGEEAKEYKIVISETGFQYVKI